MSRRERLYLVLLVLSLCSNAILVTRLHAPIAFEHFLTAISPVPEAVASDHVTGEAGPTVIAYVDFECPYCKQLYDELRKMQADGRPLRLILRHYASPDQKPGSWLAANAVECAAFQDRYWDVADHLFGRPETHSDEALRQMALERKLDLANFESCLQKKPAAERILHDFNAADDYRVRATPTYFINGHRHVGSTDTKTLERQLEEDGK